MEKKKAAKKLLTATWIISGVYLLAVVLITCFQKWLKPLQNAPQGVRNTFYFPLDDVMVSAVCFVLMLLLSLFLLHRMRLNAKTGKIPVLGIVAFGVLVPFVQKLSYYWEVRRVADSQVATETSINYVTSASYVHNLTAWATPLLFVACAIFTAGCALALFTKETE